MEPNRAGFFQRFLGRQAPEEKEAKALFRHEQREAKRKEVWETALLQTRFVVVDTETTGFDSRTDAMLSIGAVEMQGGTITETVFESLIRPEPFQTVPPAVVRLTGITDSDVEQAPALRDVLLEFVRFAKGSVLVMHHAGHDIRFLNAALWKHYRVHMQQPVIDTHEAARWLHPKGLRYTLDDLLDVYGIPQRQRHTALGDARMTALLWQQMLEGILQKDVRTLGELLEQIVLTKRG